MTVTALTPSPITSAPPVAGKAALTRDHPRPQTALFPHELPPADQGEAVESLRQKAENSALAADQVAWMRPLEMDDERIDRRLVEEATAKVQKTVSALNSSLQFQVDKETEKLVIKVIDVHTKEVIKQIPPQVVLEIAKALDKLQGLLVREKA